MDVKSKAMVLLGMGGVGRDLVRQLVRERDNTAARYQLRLEVRCLADSVSRLGRTDRFLTDEELLTAVGCKEKNQPLTACGGVAGRSTAESLEPFLFSDSILVDCTASDETATILLRNLECGGGIVLANKKPLTADWETYCELTRDPVRARWETTVGSCLPAITTLARLRACGDRIERMAGCLSGTLGFLMSGLESDRFFAELVIEAHRSGATEPDPRDDLSGMDVARKALILARGAGFRMEMTQVRVEGLLPERFREGPVARLLEKLRELDCDYRKRVEDARSRGMTLRYAAAVDRDGCRVGLTEVPPESPLGRLQGNDNLLEIHSRLFKPNPMVIQGRGAGVEATAAGVLSDIIELALY